MPQRVVIEAVWPQVDGGRFPVKRIAGDTVRVEADVFADGHDPVAAVLLYRREGRKKWSEAPMEALGNDRWAASFAVKEPGVWVYTVEGWIDRPDGRSGAVRLEPERSVIVDREKARFSAWYELFPRSWGATPGKHGTFRQLEKKLPYIREMGFDVLYFPPIHPISRTLRKGKNNALAAEPGEPGSPWAIGAREGGHKEVHPELGTLEDFRHLVAEAAKMGIETALDVALQCSPEHPYVKEHPEWFRRRPDGSIQYAENPPKKYEDIYPFDFESPQWKPLWEEMKSIFLFWIGQGVKIFRVDNPHTKPFEFWEWLISGVKKDYPDALFLSEAFTRPKVMYRLAKLGFSQSYTYFTWRHTRDELAGYFTELNSDPVRQFFRPSVWTNTPDILTAHLQQGGASAFRARLVLAATLSANYGIYGPAFELQESRPLQPGSEEYLNSEKYEIRRWDLDRPDSLRGFIARVNRIRRESPALQRDEGLAFHPVDNGQILCYSKRPAGGEALLVALNLDPRAKQGGFVDLQLEALGIPAARPFQVRDLLSDRSYAWNGARNYLELDPAATAHIFRIES